MRRRAVKIFPYALENAPVRTQLEVLDLLSLRFFFFLGSRLAIPASTRYFRSLKRNCLFVRYYRILLPLSSSSSSRALGSRRRLALRLCE